jgi:hypothetical protein
MGVKREDLRGIGRLRGNRRGRYGRSWTGEEEEKGILSLFLGLACPESHLSGV